MIRIVSLLIVDLLLLPGPRTASAADTVAPADNVLMIAVDDLNDWIGCLGGHPQALTPNMDRLAKRGVLFTNAHCVAPACNPSRAALFSGRLPRVTGVWSNSSPRVGQAFPRGPQLPEVFSRNGYQTFGTGKLLHTGRPKGLDDYFSVHQRWSPFTKREVRYTKRELPSKGTGNPRHVLKDSLGREVVLPLNRMPSDRNPTRFDGESFDWGPFDVPDEDFGDTQATDWAKRKLDAIDHDRPWLMAVGYYRPHIPLWAPARFFERFKDDPATLPKTIDHDLDDLSPIARKWAREPVTAGNHATVLKHDEWRPAVEAYLACTTYIDAEIGRLLKTLDNSPSADRTWIVLWSDHGWHLGEKEHWGKWTGWERSTRVPLIIVPPKKGPDDHFVRGSRCDAPVSLLDVYPTLVHACKLKQIPTLDGSVDPLALLTSPDAETGRLVATFFEPGNVSIRSRTHRYIRYADGSEELYNLTTDPHEWNNIATNEDTAAILEEFQDHYRQMVTPPNRVVTPPKS